MKARRSRRSRGAGRESEVGPVAVFGIPFAVIWLIALGLLLLAGFAILVRR